MLNLILLENYRKDIYPTIPIQFYRIEVNKEKYRDKEKNLNINLFKNDNKNNDNSGRIKKIYFYYHGKKMQ